MLVSAEGPTVPVEDFVADCPEGPSTPWFLKKVCFEF